MRSFLIFVLLLFAGTVSAQDTVWLKGKLVDADQLYPIPNATVKIGNTKTHSDKLGVFSIQVLSESLRSNGIDIEASGFHKLHLAQVDNSSFLYLTLLSVSRTSLQSVSVTFGGKDIIKRVCENIPINYPVKPFNQYAIQFSQVLIDDSAYILYDMAKLKFYMSGYGKKNNTFDIGLLQNKHRLKDFSVEQKKRHQNPPWYFINPFSTLPLADIVFTKNAMIDPSKWNNFTYKLKSKIKFKNRMVYPVQFATIDSTKEGSEGIILVDSATYAVCQVVRHTNWALRKAVSKQNEGSDYFREDKMDYAFDGEKWKPSAFHMEGYQVKNFNDKQHQLDFIVDVIAYPESTNTVKKISSSEQVNQSWALESFYKPGSDESWKSILDLIHTDAFQSQYPWLSKLGW